MERGDRVRVTKGKNRGSEGEVFWVGEGTWGPRVGLETTDGRKVWAKPADVVLTSTDVAPAPAVPAPRPNLMALAAALDGTAVAPALAATMAGDATTALTARVAGLELLVAKLTDRLAALERAASAVDEDGIDWSKGPAALAETLRGE
jgi:hypothetical protein